MRTLYTDLNIQFQIENLTFSALNIVFERFLRSIPKHSHGSASYEIHYIPYGKGIVEIDGKSYKVVPGTLYVTGPHVEHEQKPDKDDPMTEYCIYLKVSHKNTHTLRDASENFVSLFTDTDKWFGQDTQDIHTLMQQIFQELEQKYMGYMTQVETLLTQCIVKIIRNYQHHHESKKHFTASSLVDSKYIIVEECFLYEYENLTLSTLSARLGLSARQTERFLKDTYGKTFLQKKNEAKMSAASILLRDSDKTITDIAFQLGYSSVEHFSHAFKRYYNLKPTAYRKEQKGDRPLS